jgi:hypothetical protein
VRQHLRRPQRCARADLGPRQDDGPRTDDRVLADEHGHRRGPLEPIASRVVEVIVASIEVPSSMTTSSSMTISPPS